MTYSDKGEEEGKAVSSVLRAFRAATLSAKEDRRMSRTRTISFVALMAALGNVLSVPPFAVPVTIGPFSSAIHFTQIPIFISGIVLGPWAGLVTGVLGGVYMSFSVGIPFILGGLGLLGFFTGVFSRRLGLGSVLSSVLGWCVQAPYVFVTDYVWFIFLGLMPVPVVMTVLTTILVNMTAEALVSAVLAGVLVTAIRRAGLTF